MKRLVIVFERETWKDLDGLKNLFLKGWVMNGCNVNLGSPSSITIEEKAPKRRLVIVFERENQALLEELKAHVARAMRPDRITIEEKPIEKEIVING